MSGPTEHTQHVRMRTSEELDMLTPRGSRSDDYDGKLEAAQRELERIQHEREELERKKRELEELNSRKRLFIESQSETAEKLGTAITRIDRTLFELRQEADDLEQCRVCFAGHLEKIERVTPEHWTPDNLSEKLERASVILDASTDDYDSAAAHFARGRSGSIFGEPSKRTRAKRGMPSEFALNLRNGFAFNLPILLLGALALLIFLTR